MTNKTYSGFEWPAACWTDQRGIYKGWCWWACRSELAQLTLLFGSCSSPLLMYLTTLLIWVRLHQVNGNVSVSTILYFLYVFVLVSMHYFIFYLMFCCFGFYHDIYPSFFFFFFFSKLLNENGILGETKCKMCLGNKYVFNKRKKLCALSEDIF